MYNMILTISLPGIMIGLTLNAQLKDAAGIDTGGVISTGFTELGGGAYVLNIAAPAEGSISYFEAGSPGTVLTGNGINPFDAGDIWDALRDSYTTTGTFGESFSTMIPASVVGSANTSESMITDLTTADNDFYVGRTIVWVTGLLRGAAAAITGYDGTLKKLSFTAVKIVPANGDTFLIV